MGRKRIEIDLKAVEEAAADGLTLEEVAARLGISHETLHARKRELSEFSDAIKRGRSRANAEVTSQLFKKVRRGDLGAIVWWEKTRKNYSEKGETKHTGALTINVVRQEGGIANGNTGADEATPSTGADQA